MALAVTTPWAIREAVADRLEAVLTTGAAYAHGAADAFRRSEFPLLPGADPATKAHLAFSVEDGELEDLGQNRDNSSDPILTRCPLTVRFLFEVRKLDQDEDWNRAAKAGVAVLQSLLTLSAAWPGDWDLATPSSGPYFRRSRLGDGLSWLLCEVRLDAYFHLSLTA